MGGPGAAHGSCAASGHRLGRPAGVRCGGHGGRAAAQAPYDVFWMHGQPDEIARDILFKGTALSAPVSNLLIHAAMTAVVARRPSRRAEQVLGGLGALLVAGYLGERLVRQRLRPSGWDRLESPLLIMSIALAAAMGSHGLGGSRRVPTS
jgi:hypothetical protein